MGDQSGTVPGDTAGQVTDLTVVAAFLSFVLMVNIWEQLGLGH